MLVAVSLQGKKVHRELEEKGVWATQKSKRSLADVRRLRGVSF